MIINHTESALRRKKVKPYVRWNKETDEWTCTSYEEYDPVKPEQIAKETQMNRKVLDAISRLIIELRSQEINHNPNIGNDLKLVDEWLELEYQHKRLKREKPNLIEASGKNLKVTIVDQPGIVCAEGS